MYSIRSIIRLAACAILALPVKAATLNTRDMQAMQEAFDHIFTGIDNMVISLNSFNGGPAGIAKIVADNTALRNAISLGATKVKASPGMAIVDIIHIGGPLFVMENKISELVESLRSRKAELDKAGAGGTILGELQKDKTAMDALTNAVNKNLPLQGIIDIIANPIGKIITNKLDVGIKEWGGK
jgi:Hydrophobic surface binding protein A